MKVGPCGLTNWTSHLLEIGPDGSILPRHEIDALCMILFMLLVGCKILEPNNHFKSFASRRLNVTGDYDTIERTLDKERFLKFLVLSRCNASFPFAHMSSFYMLLPMAIA
jgi:hypothetical protein